MYISPSLLPASHAIVLLPAPAGPSIAIANPIILVPFLIYSISIPARYPVDHATWRLKPPVTASTSSTSPAK